MKRIFTNKSKLQLLKNQPYLKLVAICFLTLSSLKPIIGQTVICPANTNLAAEYCAMFLPNTIEEAISPPYNIEISDIQTTTRIHTIEKALIPNCENLIQMTEREIIIYDDYNFNFSYDEVEFITSCTFFINCPIEPKLGCPYPEALNYDDDATCDDGSCSYKNCHIDDWTALKAFYESIYFNGENDLDPWWDEMFESDTPLPNCNLSNPFSVELDSTGRVSEMRLSNDGIVGTIPSELEKLSNLTLLELYGNQLTGNIPASLGNLENLIYLDFSGNQFFGNLPRSLSNLTNLESLGLANNNLSGCYQKELVNLCSVQEIGFGDTGTSIDLGNIFNATWAEFCNNGAGTCICNNYAESSKEEYFICENESITIQAENVTFDEQSDSELAYILHNGYEIVDSIFDVNSTGFYVNDGTIPRNIQLYVSPVVGPPVTDGFPDIGNPCTFISLPGTPLFFVEPITGIIADGGCDGRFYFSYSFSGGFGDQFEISGSLTETISPNEFIGGSIFFEETITLIATDEIGCSGSTESEIILGCTYPDACNYNPVANCDDQSCDYVDDGVEIVRGCTDSEACNYDSNANCYNGSCSYSCKCNIDDWTALKALYLSTDGDNWINNNGWNEILNDNPTLRCDLSDLFGVTLDSIGRVSEIDLHDNQLSGVIPPEIEMLNNLRTLHLYINTLGGVIPSEIGNLTNLESLSLWGNTLTGTIPESIGNLNKLESLSISENNLNGNLPPQIGQLINLTTFFAQSNKLNGRLPIQLGNLINLERLSLRSNTFTGLIPIELGNITALVELYLHENQLEGNLPAELSNLINLRLLKVNDNNLTGCYSDSLRIFCEQLDGEGIDPMFFDGDIDISGENNFIASWSDFCNFGAGTCNILDCIDPCAPNYNPDAIEDDGSCETYSIDCNADICLGDVSLWDCDMCQCIIEEPQVIGCTDPNACNFNLQANCNNPNSCLDFPICNSDPCAGDITVLSDDGCSCSFVEARVYGCTDLMACNYNPEANCDDNSCMPIPTCNDNPCEGDVTTLSADGCSCNFVEAQVYGCTDLMACNYNPEANCNDESCQDPPICNTDPCIGDLEIVDQYDACQCIIVQQQVIGCTDIETLNYMPDANCDDGSCVEINFDLRLTKQILPPIKETYLPGEEITYAIIIANFGNITVDNAEIIDSIPDGLTLRDSTWSLIDNSIATTTINEVILPIDSGGISKTIPITFVIDDVPPENIINHAEINKAKDSKDNDYSSEDNNIEPDNEKPDNEIDIKVANKCHRQDFDALSSLYQQTGGPNWTNNSGWEIFDSNTAPADCDFSQLYGITVDDNNRVISIMLDSNNLKGNITTSLEGLEKLRILIINNNKLGSTIPIDLNLPELEMLDLSHNLFEGTIPDFENLPNLFSLNLSYNQFVTVPNFTSLPNLNTLDMSFNLLGGAVPSFSNLMSLVFLDLNTNNFEGQIPLSQTNLPLLQNINLSNNHLAGIIPNYNNNAELNIANNWFWFDEIADYLNYHSVDNPTIYSPQYYGERQVITVDSASMVTLTLSPELSEEDLANINPTYNWVKEGESNVLGNELDFTIDEIQPMQAGIHTLQITDQIFVPGLEIISLPIHLFVVGYDEIGSPSIENHVIYEGNFKGEQDTLREFVIDSCACNRPLYLLEMETEDQANKLIIKINTKEETGHIIADVDDDGDGSKNYGFGQDAIINDGPAFGYQLDPQSYYTDTVRAYMLDTGIDNYKLEDMRVFEDVLLSNAPFDSCYLQDPVNLPYSSGYGYTDTFITNDYLDEFGHGTFGAGAIIDNIDDHFNLEVIPLKLFNENQEGSLFKMICALYHSIDHGGNVVNISAGYRGAESIILKNTLEHAYSKNVFVVAAAGNDSLDIDIHPQYPAAFAKSLLNVISVVSIDNENQLSTFSNYGSKSTTVAAYGENIEGLGKDAVCIVVNGTSIATYFVSKALLIEIAKNKNRGIEEIWDDFKNNMLIYDEKLDEKTKYGFRLAAELVIISDEDQCCYTPFVVKQQNVSCHTASFKWDELINRIYYVVRYRRLDGLEDTNRRYCTSLEWITIDSIKINSVVLENLEEDSMYEVQFRTKCKNSISEFSDPIFFSTDRVENCNSFQRENNIFDVTAYPNPTKDFLRFYLKISEESSGITKTNDAILRIADMSGRAVMCKTLTLEPEGSSYCLDVSGLASGIYLLFFTIGDTESPAIKVMIT